MAAFKVGDEGYDDDEFNTPWWLERASDKPHKRAYQAITELGKKHRPQAGHIVDYACGPGLLVRELLSSYPEAKITAIDQSKEAIDVAPDVLKRAGFDDRALKRVKLLAEDLPNFDLKLPKADLLFFLYPDFRGGNNDDNVNYWKTVFPRDWVATTYLRRHWKEREDEDFPVPKPRESFFKRVAGQEGWHRRPRRLRQLHPRGLREIRPQGDGVDRVLQRGSQVRPRLPAQGHEALRADRQPLHPLPGGHEGRLRPDQRSG